MVVLTNFHTTKKKQERGSKKRSSRYIEWRSFIVHYILQTNNLETGLLERLHVTILYRRRRTLSPIVHQRQTVERCTHEGIYRFPTQMATRSRGTNQSDRFSVPARKNGRGRGCLTLSGTKRQEANFRERACVPQRSRFHCGKHVRVPRR